MNKAVLEAAANWWVEQITGHKINWDNGAQNEGSAEDRKTGEMMWMLGNMVANQAREKITDEQIVIFRNKLMEIIGKKQDNCILSVDYGPGEYLYEATKAAGIDSNVFPCKTVMWIKEDNITARCGYHASVEKVYPI